MILSEHKLWYNLLSHVRGIHVSTHSFAVHKHAKQVNIKLLTLRQFPLVDLANEESLPCRCFAIGLSGAISRLGAACSNTDPTASIQKALQALPGLGLSVAALNPFGSTLWGYNLTSFLIQAWV